MLFGIVAQPLVATVEDGSKQQLAGIIKAQRLTQLQEDEYEHLLLASKQ